MLQEVRTIHLIQAQILHAGLTVEVHANFTPTGPNCNPLRSHSGSLFPLVTRSNDCCMYYNRVPPTS